MAGTDAQRPVVELPREVYDAVIARAREGAPAEVCGVLAGHRDAEPPGADDPTPTAERNRVTRAVPADNAAPTPRTTYEIPPEQQLSIMESIEDRGETVVGFYHSHPAGPARPSATDAARAAWPGYQYLIVALDGEPYVGAWRWNGERFRQSVVRIGTDGTG